MRVGAVRHEPQRAAIHAAHRAGRPHSRVPRTVLRIPVTRPTPQRFRGVGPHVRPNHAATLQHGPRALLRPAGVVDAHGFREQHTIVSHLDKHELFGPSVPVGRPAWGVDCVSEKEAVPLWIVADVYQFGPADTLALRCQPVDEVDCRVGAAALVCCNHARATTSRQVSDSNLERRADDTVLHRAWHVRSQHAHPAAGAECRKVRRLTELPVDIVKNEIIVVSSVKISPDLS